MVQNKQVLTELRSNFDKPELMKELQKKLTSLWMDDGWMAGRVDGLIDVWMNVRMNVLTN